MRENSSNVSVLFYYDGAQNYARPVRLLWRGDEYELDTVQFWHTTHHKSGLMHHYTLSDKKRQFVFRLALETDNLTWRLESFERVEPQPTVSLRGRLAGALS